MDTSSNEIVARSYDKFFNFEEVPETSLESLEKNLEFPVKGYLKENGFLGILSYNPVLNDFFIASKSTNRGDFAGYFRKILDNKRILTSELLQFLKEKNVTIVFEVEDTKNDPHIIEYIEDKVILLDIFENSFKTNKYSYKKLQEISKKFDIPCKILSVELNDFQELKFFLEVSKTEEHEGYVFEDTNGFMFKHKTLYYRFWKIVRNNFQNLTSISSMCPLDAQEQYLNIIELFKKYNFNVYNFFKEGKFDLLGFRKFVESHIKKEG